MGRLAGSGPPSTCGAMAAVHRLRAASGVPRAEMTGAWTPSTHPRLRSPARESGVRADGPVRVVWQGDVIVMQGDIGRDMYFISEGSLEVRIYKPDIDIGVSLQLACSDSFCWCGGLARQMCTSKGARFCTLRMHTASATARASAHNGCT
jgi:CRP-like cAMP-binding protein